MLKLFTYVLPNAMTGGNCCWQSRRDLSLPGWLARHPTSGGRWLVSGCEETTSKRAGEQFSSDVSARQRSPVHFRRRFTTGGCTTRLRCRILRLDPRCASHISLLIGDSSPSVI